MIVGPGPTIVIGALPAAAYAASYCIGDASVIVFGPAARRLGLGCFGPSCLSAKHGGRPNLPQPPEGAANPSVQSERRLVRAHVSRSAPALNIGAPIFVISHPQKRSRARPKRANFRPIALEALPAGGDFGSFSFKLSLPD